MSFFSFGRRDTDPAGASPPAGDFSGTWISTFGPLTLEQQGDRVHGHYQYGQLPGSVEGEIADGGLRFRYADSTSRGEGWFELTREGLAFTGRWRAAGAEGWADGSWA